MTKALLILACMWPLSVAHGYSLKHTTTGGVVRWPSTTERVELRVDPRLREFLPEAQANEALYMAADAWRGFDRVPEIDIVVDEAPPEYNPDRRGGGVYLVTPWEYEANRLAITVTSYYPSGELVGVDVLVNGDVDYALLPEGPLDTVMRTKHDLGAVMTHEFGHVLGLDESEDDAEATMWPYIRAGETHQRSLSVDDEDALLDLYSRELAPETPPLTCVAGVMGTGPAGKDGLAGAGLLLAAVTLRHLRRRGRRGASTAG